MARPEPVPAELLPAVLERITPPVIGDGTEWEDHPSPRASVDLLRAGDDLGYGVIMTPEAETLWTATNEKDWITWEEKFDDARRSMPDTPEVAFLLSAQRLRAMMHSGRIEAVREELLRLEQLERQMFGNIIETTSQYAQLNNWLNNSEQAIAYAAAVVDAVDDWWLPTFYYAKPQNIVDAKRIAGALMRAHIGLTCEHIVLHDYETAMAWGKAGLEMTEDVVGIGHNPIYGIFVETTTYMYEGQAWMLACYAAARIGVSRDLEANAYLVDLAKDFFRQAQYRWGDELVDSIVDYVLYDTGLKPQEPARIGMLGEPPMATDARLDTLVRFRPENLQVREGIELPVPEPGTVRLPGQGKKNAYGFIVGPDLAAANAAFLEGDYAGAAARFDRIATAESDPLRRWHAAAQAAQALILAGRSAEAVERMPALEALEEAYFGTNIGARALRGNAKFWLGDNDGAIRDYLQVVEALGDFRAPALLLFKPQVPELALLNRAQFQAYLGLARSLMVDGDHRRALTWSEAAEQLLEEAHYTWQHQLYRQYLKLHADLFYARGANLAAMAGAKLVLGGAEAEAERLMDTARGYLRSMEYEAGLPTIEAIWARSLLDSGRPARAVEVATAAARFTAERGQVDQLWQLQALRGAALASLGRHGEAETALRAADSAVEAVSGSLATDSSKRQFGIGKDELTRRLVAYDLGRGDHERAFADLESGRARAFVDMLGSVRLEAARHRPLVQEIRDVDAGIRATRVRAAAPGSYSGAAAALGALESRRASLVAGLRARDPELADALSISARSLRDVQRRLDPGDLLLYTLPAADRDAPIRFLAIRRDGSEIVESDLGHGELDTLLAPFTSDDPLRAATAQSSAAETIAAGLHLRQGAARGTLYVVPSQSLYFVPWGALPIDRPVVVLPTGGWVTRSPARIAAGSATVIGDPALGTAWATLPGAREEAERVAGLYGVTPVIGAAATIDGIRAAVRGGTRVLHLATHGVFNARDPLDSAILLSDGGGTARLTAADLFEHPLPAALVVLSACETGLGQVSAGDDFLGLARSFYLSGTRAVLNSLWPVHDKPTRRFMEVFHRAARDGDLGAAWLKARNDLRDAGLPPSVYGAFVLGGADRI